MVLFAFPAPSGAAVRLIFGVPKGSAPLVLASRGSTIPGPDDPDARRVVTPGSRLYPAAPLGVFRPREELSWYSWVDAHPDLETGPIRYTLYAVGGPPVPPASLEVDPTPLLAYATVGVARDLLRPRLEYHLARAVRAGRFGRVNDIPILEVESLAQGEPIPVVLMKELLFSLPHGIGLEAGEWKDQGSGKLYRERSHLYRARVDLLVLAQTPGQRTEIANALHEAVLLDQPLLEDLGLRGIGVQRATTFARDPNGNPVFGEEVTVDGEVRMSVREELHYALAPGYEVTFQTSL